MAALTTPGNNSPKLSPMRPEDVIEAAVDRIESDGLTEWAPVSSPDDYDDHDDEEPFGEDDLNEIARELDDLISGIPDPASDPVFRLGDGGLVHMAEAPDRQPEVRDGDLLAELRSAAAALRSSLEGTNAHTDLLQAVENYEEALLEDPVSVSRLYGRGVAARECCAFYPSPHRSGGPSGFHGGDGAKPGFRARPACGLHHVGGEWAASR